MPADQAKIILFETEIRALREMQSRLSSRYSVQTFFEDNRLLEAVKADRDIKMVIVSTARGSDSLGLLDSVRRMNSAPLRILLTGFEDLSLIVEGLHGGTVQRVISKPLQESELMCIIRGLGPAAWSGSQRSA